MVYIKAEEGDLPAGYAKTNRDYYDKDGNKLVRVGGSRSWRNNNPGNLRYYRFARENGAIGKDGHGFAIFPDEHTGQSARRKLLKGSVYRNLSIDEMTRKYEPEPGRTEAYCKCIEKRSGLSRSRILNSLTEHEIDRLLAAMQRCEGWDVGEEFHFPLRRITAVRRGKNGTYQVFEIEAQGWLAKGEAIQFAEKNNLRAVIVHLRNGSKYLRSLPSEPTFRQLLVT